ncbi:hypothetical protein MW332_004745 [Vibrio parahaemolyticus]|nr:hypothetical protein [Vibrio parahaemolyticus]
MSKIGFIACAHFEDTIHHFGEGATPEQALHDFVSGGAFIDFCCCRGIDDGTHVEVKVFKAIYSDTPEAEMYDFEDGWKWILGDEVRSEQVLF